jgi:hypothetical protein
MANYAPTDREGQASMTAFIETLQSTATLCFMSHPLPKRSCDIPGLTSFLYLR